MSDGNDGFDAAHDLRVRANFELSESGTSAKPGSEALMPLTAKVANLNIRRQTLDKIFGSSPFGKRTISSQRPKKPDVSP